MDQNEDFAFFGWQADGRWQMEAHTQESKCKSKKLTVVLSVVSSF
jgi:hypothetical protein